MYEAYDYGNEFAYNDYFYSPAVPYQTQAAVMPSMPAYQTPYQQAAYPSYTAPVAAATSYPQVYYDEPPKVYQVRRTLYQPPAQQQQQAQVYQLQPQVQAYYGNQPVTVQAQQPYVYQTGVPQTTAALPRVYQANPTTTVSPTRIAYTQPIQQTTTAMPITSMRSPYSPQRASLAPVQMTQAQIPGPARVAYNGYYWTNWLFHNFVLLPK